MVHSQEQIGKAQQFQTTMMDRSTVRLDPIAAQTYRLAEVVSGTGPPGGEVNIRTDYLTVVRTIDASGNWCDVVPLAPNTTTSLDIYAVMPDHTETPHIAAEIVQLGTSSSGTTAANKLLDADVGGSVELEEGEGWDMTDGDHDSYALVSNAWWDDDYLWFAIHQSFFIDNIVVWGAEDCPLGHYQIWTSDDDAPGAPTVENQNWELACDVENLTSAQCQFSSPETMRHVVLWFISPDCQSWDGTGQHKIIDVEAWTQESQVQPTESAPSCGT